MPALFEELEARGQGCMSLIIWDISYDISRNDIGYSLCIPVKSCNNLEYALTGKKFYPEGWLCLRKRLFCLKYTDQYFTLKEHQGPEQSHCAFGIQKNGREKNYYYSCMWSHPTNWICSGWNKQGAVLKRRAETDCMVSKRGDEVGDK